ncbi:MAG: LacI family DNA-binding transcriptional regulator [Phycisphaerae bacterium]|nr:LacI family DNA-binding transcriptional regulator [Phycisphaerae bacterium]
MATLKDIALKAGVSVNTVSRVLNGKNREIWASSIRRADEIRKCAKELGFRPNAAARMMKRGSFKRVACIVLGYGHEDMFASSMPIISSTGYVSAGTHELAMLGYPSVLEPIPVHSVTKDVIKEVDLFLEDAVDGVLAISLVDNVPAKLDRRLKNLGVPVVWVNREKTPGQVCVYPDEVQNSRLLARHLIELGHRHIGYVGSCGHRFNAVERPKGIIEELQASGLSTEAVLTEYRKDWHEPGVRAGMIERVLATSPRPTAIIFDYKILYDLGAVILSQHGLRIPVDVSICSFVTVGESSPRSLVTSLVLPEIDVARRGAELLVEMIAGKELEEYSETFIGRLYEGETTTRRNDGLSGVDE